MAKKDMSLEGAVACAIDECISEGILTEFLSKNRREAIRVSVLECRVEDVMKTPPPSLIHKFFLPKS